MALPVFFELHRVQGLPIYVNASHVSSIDFLGTEETGYVACLAVNTMNYLWGDVRALEALFETTPRGSNSALVTVVSNKPVSPGRLFGSKICLDRFN